MGSRLCMILFSLLAISAFAENASAYYHPKLGRFIARDPIGYDANDMNLYGYVGGKPLARSDPNGTEVTFPHPIPNSFPLQTDHKACNIYMANLQRDIDKETDKEKKEILRENLNRPTIVCFCEKPITCVFPKTFPEEGRPVANDVAYRMKLFCRRAHEQFHADHHVTCKGVADYKPAEWKRPDYTIERLSECSAYKQEILCLAKALNSTGDGTWCKNTPECLRRIQREINRLIRNGEGKYNCTQRGIPLEWPPDVPKLSNTK